MTEEALQIDFRPQPRGIAVVTSAPISSIAERGNYSAFQDLIDGYASSFARVHVFSPSGEPVVKPVKGHRVSWHSGPRWVSPTIALFWSALSCRGELHGIELVRTFGARAGFVGRALSKLSNSPHVSSPDDLVGNSWRGRSGWNAAPIKTVNKLGLLRADMLSATHDWELEFLSEAEYDGDLLLGKTGFATDIYTPLDTTDPNRHPVVLWTGSISGEDSISLVEKAAIAAQGAINNVEFIVVADGQSAEKLREDVIKHDLPITITTLDGVEPLVDLIERTWVCITEPSRGLPHGLAMLAASAGVPLLSLGELEERHGFKSHLNYGAVEPDNYQAAAYGLQLLRRWTTWSLRIGSAGQKLINEEYSTRAVAIKEGEQLARIARNEELERDSPVPAKTLKPYVSPVGIEFSGSYTDAGRKTDQAEIKIEDDWKLADGFDLVAAALAEMSNGTITVEASPVGVSESSDDMNQKTVSSLPVADDSGSTTEPEREHVSDNLNPDAVLPSVAENDTEFQPEAEPEPAEHGDLDQDAISALFAAEAPELNSEPDLEPKTNLVSIQLDELDEDAVPTSDESEACTEDGDEVSEESSDLNLPDVKIVQLNSSDEVEDESYSDDLDEVDVDPDLIASILEGKDVDPAA